MTRGSLWVVLGALVGIVAVVWATGADPGPPPEAQAPAAGAGVPPAPSLAGRHRDAGAATPGHETRWLADLRSEDEARRHRALRRLKTARDRLPMETLIEIGLLRTDDGYPTKASRWAQAEIGKRKAEASGHVASLLERILTTDADVERIGAARLVATIGTVPPEAVPLLVRVFEAPASGYATRRNLVEVAGSLGPDGLPLAPALLAFTKEILDDRHTAEMEALKSGVCVSWDLVELDIGRALAAMGEGVIPLVIDAIRTERRLRAAREPQPFRMWDPVRAWRDVLLELGEVATPALLELTGDAALRGIATSVLAGSKVTAPRVRDALLDALRDDDADIRAHAAAGLGHQDPEAVPALLEALSDDSGRVRRNAAKSLRRLGAAPDEALAPLLAALDIDDTFQALAILRSVVDLGEPAAVAIPRLCALFDRAPDDAWFRRRIADEIAKLAPFDLDAVLRAYDAGGIGVERGVVEVLARTPDAVDPAGVVLDAALASADVELRTSAAALLARHGRRDVYGALVDGLGAASRSVQGTAASGLAHFGRDAVDVLPRLLELLTQTRSPADDGRPGVRASVVQIGRHDLPRMLPLLTADDIDASVAAGLAFRAAGEAGLAFLASAWRRAGDELRAAILGHVRAFVPSSNDPAEVAIARSLVIDALDDPVPAIRAEAARTLGEDAGARPAVLETLVGLLDVPEEAAMAAYRLSEHGAGAAPVATALRARRDHPDAEVRTYLRTALERIEDAGR